MFARQQMKALPTHFLVTGVTFNIVYIRLCCNNLSQNNASDDCQLLSGLILELFITLLVTLNVSGKCMR
jgi:hypothetical protein